MPKSGAGIGGCKPRPLVALSLLTCVAAALAISGPPLAQATAVTLPVPVGLPSLPTLPSGSSGSPSRTATAPPRPSRSPPSLCPGFSLPGFVAFAASVFPCDFPDPMVLKVKGAWYAYGSSAGWEPAGASFPILRSEDLRHWQAVGNALSGPPAWTETAWTEKDMWGPSVIRWQGRYLLFYSASRAPTGRHCVAVATASGPQGPFAPRRIIACHSGRQRGFIDPAPLAVGRRLYLFFSVDEPQHSIDVLALNRSGLRSTGRSARVLGVSPRWGQLNAATVEGPSPLKRNGRYYLFYSAGSWDSDYRMAYAVASSPLGPYRDAAPVAVIGSLPGLPAPGGGAVLSGPGQSNWLAFAAWTGTPGYGLGSQRTLRIAPVRWSRRGVPRVLLTG